MRGAVSRSIFFATSRRELEVSGASGVFMRNAILPRERLIVALDMPDVADAERLAAELGADVAFYKVGMELAYGGGFGLVERLVASGKQVFLDLKLHDIPNTVERAVAQIARLGATFLTIHAYPQTMRAAVVGRGGSSLKLLGVSVLTSSDDADLREAGYAFGVGALVARRGAQALTAKVDGLVASAAEAAMLRAELGESLLLVTPGIRPVGEGSGDQKRVATPGQAIRDGADYLVVGRPVTQAGDPKAAAKAIIAEIAEALSA
jgi:orotidine-5'-phosphate decarboxylase